MSERCMPAVWTTALLILAGCQLAPPPQRIELPTAPTYPAEYSGDATDGVRAPELAWRDFFADPRLAALIDIALRRNRDLAIAVARVTEARAVYRVQRADQLPTFGIEASATRTHSSGSTAVPGGDLFSSGSEPTTFERYSTSLGLAVFELDFWGRVRNLSAAALAEYLATEQAQRAFRLSLVRDVSLAYLASLESRERIELAQATLASRREGLRIAQRRLDAGVTSALDFRQAETLLTQAETELAALRLSRAQSENLLTTLVGSPLDRSLPDALPLSQQTQTSSLLAGLPAQLLISRPDLRAAEQRLRASRANIGAARAAFLPSITLTGSFGYASTELDALLDTLTRDGSANTWSVGPGIDLPLFDFGRRRANLAAAHARSRIALAQYERTIQTAFREVADALAGRRYLAEQVDAQERAVQAQRRLAELARTRYREGVVGYLEVLDAERSLFAAEQALLQVRRSAAANQVTLYVALGGGTAPP